VQASTQASAGGTATVEIEIVPPEVEREPDAFECIGSETREVLERRPAAVVAVKLVYKKFARKDRERGGETEVLGGRDGRAAHRTWQRCRKPPPFAPAA